MNYLTIDQVATRFGVHRKTVRAWIRTGRLRAFRIGPRLIRIDPEAVDQFSRPVPTRQRVS